MTTDTQERSVAAGEPIELYRFGYGTGAATVFTYCNGDVEIEHDSRLYAPLAGLDRDAINASGSLDKSDLIVTVPHDSAVAQLFNGYPPSAVVGLTIFLCHLQEDGTHTIPTAIWIGRVLGGNQVGYEAELTCQPLASGMERIGLQDKWQYMCQLVHYGPECGANRAEHTVLSSASAVDPRSVTVPGLLSDQYLGGMVSWTPVGRPVERRTILEIEQDTGLGTSQLIVTGQVRDLAPGDTVELALGCRHNLGDCRDVFDNAPNFDGDPWIPLDNPHGSTRVFQ